MLLTLQATWDKNRCIHSPLVPAKSHGGSVIQNFLADLRFTLRMIVRDVRLNLAVIFCVMLGIGVNSAMFTIVNSILLKPLAVSEPGELVTLFSSYPGFSYGSFSYPNFVDVRDGSDVFSSLSVARNVPVNLSQGESNERLMGSLVSGNYFSMLGVDPARGRAFAEEEDGAPGAHPVVVISHSLWTNRFASDPDLLGSTLRLNGHPFTVIGIAAPGFRGTSRMFAPDLWVPIAMQPQIGPKHSLTDREYGWLTATGRLQSGISLAQAQGRLDQQAARLREQYPEALEDWGLHLAPGGWSDLPPNAQSVVTAAAGVMMAISLFVLLIACANVAGLLLSRSEARRREIGIRLSIGASRGRLVRQLLTESLGLALLGGALGWGLSIWTLKMVPYLLPPLPAPFVPELNPNVITFGFTFLLAVITSLIFGLAPALQATRPGVVAALKAGEIYRVRRFRMPKLRNTLVVFQVAVSVLLLTIAGLFIRSLAKAKTIDPGFVTENLVLAALDPSLNNYSEQQGTDLYLRLMESAKTLPGVESVSFAEAVPLSLTGNQQVLVSVEGYEPAPEERMNINYNIVGPDYFQTMGISLIAGQEFTREHRADTPKVMAVNRVMAQRYWPNGEAIGGRVRTGEDEWWEVIAVVEDIKYDSLGEAPKPYLYVPFLQSYEPALQLHVRSSGDPVQLANLLRTEIRTLAPYLPVEIRTIEEQTRVSLAPARAAATLAGAFGALALALAVVGLYGLLAHSVSRRAREIGLRMALGARSWDVFSYMLRRGAILTFIGLGVGLLVALAAGRVLDRFLYGLSGNDPLTLISVVAVLSATAFIAIFFPARQSILVDPMKALREQ